MTQSELVKKLLSRYSSLNQQKAKAIVKNFFKGIAKALAEGKKVEIRAFGSFNVKVKPVYRGRTLQTGKSVMISQRKIISFKASSFLHHLLNHPEED